MKIINSWLGSGRDLIVRLAKLLVFKVFSFIDFFWPKSKSIAVFGSFGARRYFDNSRYLYEHFINSERVIKSYWVAHNRNADIPGDVLIVGSLKYYFICFSAKYIFVSYGMYDVGHL